MRRNEDEAVDLRHGQCGEIGRSSRRGARQAPVAFERGLLDVKRIKAGATRIAQQNDFVEALLFEEMHACRHIEQDKLVLEAQIVADRARSLRPRRAAGCNDIRDQVMARHEFTRVHDTNHGVRLAAHIEAAGHRCVVGSSQHDIARCRSVRNVARAPVRVQEPGGHRRMPCLRRRCRGRHVSLSTLDICHHGHIRQFFYVSVEIGLALISLIAACLGGRSTVPDARDRPSPAAAPLPRRTRAAGRCWFAAIRSRRNRRWIWRPPPVGRGLPA